MENNQSLPFKCSNCDEVFEKKICLESHMAKHTNNKHPVLHAENTVKRDPENKTSKKGQHLKCKLCYEKFADNEESKTHYVKAHMNEIYISKTANECQYIYCMDIEEDKCLKYCYFTNI